MDWKSIPPHSERWHGWLDPWLVSRVGAPLSEAPMPLPSNGRLKRNEEKGWRGGGESYLLTTLSTHESMIINSLLKPFESFTRIGRAGREVEMGRLMTGCRPAPSFAPPGPQAPGRFTPLLMTGRLSSCSQPSFSLLPASSQPDPGTAARWDPVQFSTLYPLFSFESTPSTEQNSCSLSKKVQHHPDILAFAKEYRISLQLPIFITYIYPWSFESSAKKKQFYLGQLTQMWVGRAGWTQTFINHCFYCIFDPFFATNKINSSGKYDLAGSEFTFRLIPRHVLESVFVFSTKICIF